MENDAPQVCGFLKTKNQAILAYILILEIYKDTCVHKMNS